MDFKMCSYVIGHNLKAQVQKTAFQKHDMNKIGAAKTFIGKISMAQN